MQKYVLVTLLQDLSEGAEFSMQDWPLHVTISPRFAVDWESTNLLDKLTKTLIKHKPIQTTAGADESFGEDKQVPVTLVEMTPQLQALHDDTLKLLEEAGAVFDDEQYTGPNYRAHVTIQKNGRVQRGDPIAIDTVTIIDMFPNQDIKQRNVLQTIPLGK